MRFIEHLDGKIEFGYGRDSHPPGEKFTGMATNGPASEWWRIHYNWGETTVWHLCYDARRYERVLGGAAISAAEFAQTVKTYACWI